jgi:protein arginine kinase
MNLDDLTRSSGEWLRGTGPESDIVMCSRIRLARNLADFPFSNRSSRGEKAEIEQNFRAAVDRAGLELAYLDVNAMPELDRQFLVERQLISRELKGGDGPRGVAIGPRENMAIMVNEEDHLRVQVMNSGLSLPEVWDQINRLDDTLEEQLAYAYSPQLGYLTACPTNVGTGIRVGVMLHLPALVHTKQIDKVFRALQKINLAVRGLYGEGTQAFGDFYQVSNQQTLGKSEMELIRILNDVVPQVIQYERTARNALMNERRQHLHDQVSRAYGVLKTAHTISSEETMLLLSSVRMGINLGLIDDLAIATVNELFIQTQPAYLQKLQGTELGVEERNIARASYLRSRLANANGRQHAQGKDEG